VPFAVGSLLLFAAGLKVQQFFTSPPSANDGLFFSGWPLLVLMDVEIVCGLALLVGFVPRVTRRCCQLLFAGFSAFSVYQLAFGAKTCGCLGNLEVRPLAMISLDLVVFASLCSWRPMSCTPRYCSFVFLSVVVFALGLAPTAGWLASPESLPTVTVMPPSVDLGTSLQGDRIQFSLLLRNDSNQAALMVERFESSCPCLQPKERSLLLGPREERGLHLEVDLGKEPEFTGHLVIQLKGLTASGEGAFLTSVAVQVLPKTIVE